MNGGREHLVTEAFVSIANSLVGEFDVIDLLNGLTTNCGGCQMFCVSPLLMSERKISEHGDRGSIQTQQRGAVA